MVTGVNPFCLSLPNNVMFYFRNPTFVLKKRAVCLVDWLSLPHCLFFKINNHTNDFNYLSNYTPIPHKTNFTIQTVRSVNRPRYKLSLQNFHKQDKNLSNYPCLIASVQSIVCNSLTRGMKLLQWIHNCEKPIGRKGCESENGHTNRDVLRSFGELADQLAPGPRFQCVDHRGEGHARYYDQQVGQGEREDVP